MSYSSTDSAEATGATALSTASVPGDRRTAASLLPASAVVAIALGDLEAAARELSQLSSDSSALVHAAVLAALNGQLPVLRHVRETLGADIHANEQLALIVSAARGWVDVFDYIYSQGGNPIAVTRRIVEAAARYGHLKMLRRIHEVGCTLDNQTELVGWLASRASRRQLFDYFVAMGAAPGASKLANLLTAIRSSSTDAVRGKLSDLDLESYGQPVAEAAARTGAIPVLRLLHESGLDLAAHGGAALLAAALAGRLAMVQFILSRASVAAATRMEAVRAAAESGHYDVVSHLVTTGTPVQAAAGATLRLVAFNGHEATFDLLTDAGLNGIEAEHAAINAMKHELLSAAPVYHPSKLWEFFNAVNLEQLRRFGMHRFKRCVNQNYFNYVPLGFDDAQLSGLASDWLAHPTLAPLRTHLADPDRYPDAAGKRPSIDRRIFRLGVGTPSLSGFASWAQRQMYRTLVGALWRNMVRHDRLNLHKGLREPHLGTPIVTWLDGRQISQDLAHSVRECNTILDGVEPPAHRQLRIAEVGPGYGRVGDVLLSTRRCSYFVFDIPPSLAVAQWYLRHRHAPKQIFLFRPFDSFETVRTELESADIAFFTSNQLSLFPDGYFDIMINISSLHEMRPAQMHHILGEMYRVTADRVYLKQYRRYVNPWDKLEMHESEYPVPAAWERALWREDTIDHRYFEALLKRSGNLPEAAAAAAATHAPPPRRATVSVVLANYNDAPFLRTSLEAILAQTEPADEIIVVDDGSDDDSVEVIENLLAHHPSGRLLKHEVNRGQYTAIQRALVHATGDYVVWAASDDLLLPEFLAKSRAAIAAHPGVGLCFSRLAVWRDGTSEVTEFSERNHGVAFDLGEVAKYFSPAELAQTLRDHYVWISGNTVLARRDALMEMGGFEHALRWHADWFAFYAIALRHGACGIPETLALMRDRVDTYSRSGMQNKREQTTVLRDLVDVLKRPEYRDLLPVFREGPSLLSPFGKRFADANLFRFRHWDVVLPFIVWQAKRRMGMAKIRHRDRFACLRRFFR